MSAIAGLWRGDGRQDAPDDVRRMLAALDMYGPHAVGQWDGDGVSLGRRLYRTLPEDAFDRQPVSTTDGRLTLVADLRLDNRDELASALRWRAAQSSDADLLLAALVRWGESALDRIVGDFAFALWDSVGRRLTLARDCVGQRPLFYHKGDDCFAFATMPRGLHALREVPREPDEAAAAEFLTLLPADPATSFFKHMARVEPGSVLTMTRGGVDARRYWSPARPPRVAAKGADYAEGLRHHLDQATRARLRGADSAVAAQLSAGLDSSAVAATAARLLAPHGGRVVAFTAVPRAGYDGPAPLRRFGDEGPLAAATAALYPNMEHVLIRAGGRSPLAGLDRDFHLFERPILNLCNAVWSRAILGEAQARGLSVMLTGAMGNATFSYAGGELLGELTRQGRLPALLSASVEQLRHGKLRLSGLMAQIIGPYLPAWLWSGLNRAWGRHTTEVLEYTAIRADSLRALDIPRLARERQLDLSYRPWKNGFDMRLWMLGRFDQGQYVKGTLAGWGVDLRDPTADRRLIEYCLSIPTEVYIAGGVHRALARRALADRLPEAVRNAPLKGYQAIDWHEGLTAARGEVASELDRLAAVPAAAELIDLQRLQTLSRDWPTDGWERPDVSVPYRLALLRAVSIGHFLRRASGSNA